MANPPATLNIDDPVAIALVQAIQVGDNESLQRLLDSREGLASVRIKNNKGSLRTLLHVATDWPGYFPNGPAVVRLLIKAGADPDAPVVGDKYRETPLHWAASSDDVDVAEALIDGGADMEAQGASIGDGSTLDNAVGYGCWHVARYLVERGAPVDKLWHAAALGMLARLEELFTISPGPSPEKINEAFWQACHGGQLRAAEYLLGRGADMNWSPDYNQTAPIDIAESLGTRRRALVTRLHYHGARAAEKLT